MVTSQALTGHSNGAIAARVVMAGPDGGALFRLSQVLRVLQVGTFAAFSCK
jgi:hypothetical protein